MRNYNEDAMKLDFLTADWQPVYNANCVDSKWKEWLRIWNSIVDKHCPLITKPVKSNPTPWLHGNAELREVIQRRNGAHSTADRSGSPEDWTAYHDLRRQASQLITDAKSGFFSSLLDNRKKHLAGRKKIYPAKEGATNALTLSKLNRRGSRFR